MRPPVLIAGALLLHVRGRARSRARRVARLHALRRLQLKERRALTHSKGLDELPSWLSRPNFEDPAWLNTLLAKLWPFVAKTLQVGRCPVTPKVSSPTQFLGVGMEL